MAGSNTVVMGLLQGVQTNIPVSAHTVHVDDVARAHVQALDPKITNNQNFGCTTLLEGIVWEDAFNIVKKHFPEAVEKGILPLGGSHVLQKKPKYDCHKTEEVMGFKFQSFEAQVVSLVSWYLEVVQKKQAQTH